MGEAVSRKSQGILPAMAECARETGSSCALFSSTVALPLGRQFIFTVLVCTFSQGYPTVWCVSSATYHILALLDPRSTMP